MDNHFPKQSRCGIVEIIIELEPIIRLVLLSNGFSVTVFALLYLLIGNQSIFKTLLIIVNDATLIVSLLAPYESLLIWDYEILGRIKWACIVRVCLCGPVRRCSGHCLRTALKIPTLTWELVEFGEETLIKLPALKHQNNQMLPWFGGFVYPTRHFGLSPAIINRL